MFRLKRIIVPLLIVISFLFIHFDASAQIKNNTNSKELILEEAEKIDKSNKLTGQRLEGFALKQPVSVYAGPSRDSAVLKNYNYNHSLVFHPYSLDWYQAVVFLNGIAYRGYIHKSDVGNHDEAPRVEGIALNKTTVYNEMKRESRGLKSYNKGSILKYRAHNKDWYIATVYLNGKRHTGYIAKADVETVATEQKVIEGIGVKKPTKVYSLPSVNSKVRKSYSSGHVLRYRTFSKNWFEATVYINGKPQTGYISATDVEPLKDIKQKTLNGVGVKQPTRVYSLASKNSKTLKSYKYGHILKFRTFSNNWYEATVYISGKPQTGYIFKHDVSTDLDSRLKGYALPNSTAVYSDTSRKSKVLKQYKKGHLLQYRPHNNNWFRATVYVNGKAKSGYIHTRDVSPHAPKLRANALKNLTHVYSKTSRNSAKLKSYKKGHLLLFRPYNDFWYEATVYIKGKARTGYIHVNDVGDLPAKKEEPGFNIPILMYHQVGDNPRSEEYGRFVTEENFRKQMEYLKSAGFTPIHFDEFPNIGNIKKPIIITFDDGYENNMNAYNVLKELNDTSFKTKATFFIIGSKIDDNDYLSQEQIKEISDSGIISIQSHTMTHPFFNDSETVEHIDYTKQLQGSKEKLEEITGRNVTALAYPYGSYNESVIAETKKYYDYAVTTTPGIANTKDSPYELKRIRVSFDTTLESFRKSIDN